ncbi:hypothetical protein Lalb_Chr13g0302351 [Lupinus albus]|uniref:Uncharacterized protein n=1 Tax=Lupinus albus TaxID=3870 RepID=A0A6A4PK08_LUPAL|nr:hypothetical protein Lalb_Chr13g0302351 [Lupinus albus]
MIIYCKIFNKLTFRTTHLILGSDTMTSPRSICLGQLTTVLLLGIISNILPASTTSIFFGNQKLL